jgi:DNA (cytosine-5)-methyltransferase 1
VAQRRRRVFVVASARNDFNPAEILFEFNGVRRDIAPSREARKEVTECAGTLTANGGGLNRPAGNANELDFCVTVEPTYAIQGSMIGRNDNAGPQGDGINEEVCFTQNCVDRHAVAQPMPINTMVALRHEALGEGTGFGIGDAGDPAYTLTKGHSHAVAQPVAFHPTQDPISSINGTTHGLGCGSSSGQASVAVSHNMAVRRLTPIECERLQGFPDNYTNIPWRNKPESPDGPRYKALGNSWAVPVVHWIGKRINEAVK